MTPGHVVCLHGIWMPGVEMAWIANRLNRANGFDYELFHYPSVRASLDDNASRLVEVLKKHGQSTVHLLGHSLGGIVALRALALEPSLPVARVVCLGSPLAGSAAARKLYRQRWARPILGLSLPAGTVDRPAIAWSSAATDRYEIGVIAGSRPAGLGRLVARFTEASDGTVAVAETRLPGAADHIVLPVSHTGMVFSSAVAEQAAAFFTQGSFLRE